VQEEGTDYKVISEGIYSEELDQLHDLLEHIPMP
jgi:hypothetical protein